jgi:hypothetical protein
MSVRGISISWVKGFIFFLIKDHHKNQRIKSLKVHHVQSIVMVHFFLSLESYKKVGNYVLSSSHRLG